MPDATAWFEVVRTLARRVLEGFLALFASPPPQLALDTAEDAVARAVSHAARAHAASGEWPHALIVEVQDPGERPSLATLLQHPDLRDRLRARVRAQHPGLPTPAVRVRYTPGAPAVSIQVGVGATRPAPARLRWAPTGFFALDGTRVTLLAGRGERREEPRGAVNDIRFDPALPFVSRDIFDLRWHPETGSWHVHPNVLRQRLVQIVRDGLGYPVQADGHALRSGDCIRLLSAVGPDVLDISFELLPSPVP